MVQLGKPETPPKNSHPFRPTSARIFLHLEGEIPTACQSSKLLWISGNLVFYEQGSSLLRLVFGVMGECGRGRYPEGDTPTHAPRIIQQIPINKYKTDRKGQHGIRANRNEGEKKKKTLPRGG